MRRGDLDDDGQQDCHTVKKHRSRGQALVEFALVIPLFLILLFGIIDVARYVYTNNAVGNGAREAARSGSVGIRPSPDCDGLTRQACVIAIAGSRSWGIPATAITTTVACQRYPAGVSTPTAIAVSACRSNDLLTVRSSVNFTLVTPVIAQFFGSLTVTGDSQVTVNQ